MLIKSFFSNTNEGSNNTQCAALHRLKYRIFLPTLIFLETSTLYCHHTLKISFSALPEINLLLFVLILQLVISLFVMQPKYLSDGLLIILLHCGLIQQSFGGLLSAKIPPVTIYS